MAEAFEQITLAFQLTPALGGGLAGGMANVGERSHTADGRRSAFAMRDLGYQSKQIQDVVGDHGGNIDNVSRACYETYGLVARPLGLFAL